MKTLYSLPPRQQSIVRHLLYNDQGLTLDELASFLGISRNAVNQHIVALEKSNSIESRLLPSEGGRPSRAYSLSSEGKEIFPKQYALFSKVLLKAVNEKLKGKELESLLSIIGKELAQSFKPRVMESNNKILEVNLIMEELGYETNTLENKNSSSEIIAKNCVFHEIAKENSSVCVLDRSLISSLLDKEVEQTECMVKGGKSCRFCITSGPNPDQS